MKLKLAGLLLFSQASSMAPRGTPEWSAETVGAQAVSFRIYENNYQDKMCSEDLFIVDPKTDKKVYTPGHEPSTISAKERASSIKMQHEAYCYSKGKYEKAVESKREKGADIPSLDRDMKKNGIVVAVACEKLKFNKKYNKDDFDYYFRVPKTCRPVMR